MCPGGKFNIETRGRKLTVGYAQRRNGKYEAQDFLLELLQRSNRQGDVAALFASFERLAEFGYLHNPEIFKLVEGEIWEFKQWKYRVFGFHYDAADGQRFFWLTSGTIKRDRHLDRSDIDRAQRIMKEWRAVLQEEAK